MLCLRILVLLTLHTLLNALAVACNLILKGVRMLSGRWTNSHRCSWITVYVLCCNAQMNLIVIILSCMVDILSIAQL